MKDRNTIINEIQDRIGSGGSPELAEQVFYLLRADGLIGHDDQRGFEIDETVDLIHEAEVVSKMLTRTLAVTEVHHNGRIKKWCASSKEDFVIRVLEANLKAGDLSPSVTYEDAVQWLRSDLRSLEIKSRPDADYPEGLGGESAYCAADGPRDQTIPELQRIERIARAHGTEQSDSLADEARAYLAWLADHDSCADMPENWEAE